MERVHDLGLRYVAEGATAEHGAAPESLRWFLGFLVEGWSRGWGGPTSWGSPRGSAMRRSGPAYLRMLLEPTLHSAEARIALHMARGEIGPCDVRVAAVELVAPVIVVLLHQRALGGSSVRPPRGGALPRRARGALPARLRAGPASGPGHAQSRGVRMTWRSRSSSLPGSGWWSYRHCTRGGSDMRMDSVRPPVSSPKTVPRSWSRLNST